MDFRVILSTQAVDWFQELAKYGMFVVDGNGVATIAPKAAETLDALHTVLAGGKVTITVKTQPDQQIKGGLDQKLEVAVASSNEPPSGGITTQLSP